MLLALVTVYMIAESSVWPELTPQAEVKTNPSSPAGKTAQNGLALAHGITSTPLAGGAIAPPLALKLYPKPLNVLSPMVQLNPEAV
jgi:hypothetical protein